MVVAWVQSELVCAVCVRVCAYGMYSGDVSACGLPSIVEEGIIVVAVVVRYCEVSRISSGCGLWVVLFCQTACIRAMCQLVELLLQLLLLQLLLLQLLLFDIVGVQNS